MTPRHEAALAYVGKGIPVFPIAPGLKRPPAVAHSFYDASADPRQINEWWVQADYNIGACPEHFGHLVVDLDGPEGLATWQQFEVLFAAPPTLMVRTPSGGIHLYFRGSAPPSARRLGPGLDIRGRTSYVLLPPSIVNGVEYAVIVD